MPSQAGQGSAKLAASQASSATTPDVHHARNEQGIGDAEPLGNGKKARAPIEIHVLAGVEDVEAANPERDGGTENQHARIEWPVTAIHAAAGEMPRAKPRNRCDQLVKRLVKE